MEQIGRSIRQRWDVAPDRRDEIISAIQQVRRERSERRHAYASIIIPQFSDYTLRTLFGLVHDVTGVPRDDIRTPRINRKAKAAAARHLFIWLAHRFTMHSLPALIRYVGRKDHTTAIHAVRRVNAVIKLHQKSMPHENACPTQWACAIWEVWGYAR
jgi:chromosomal replication initiation ATPase DnaA